MATQQQFSDYDLLYAATARCACGAGLAYPFDRDRRPMSAWMCSAVLKDEASDGQHDALLWSLYKVREETSINNTSGLTTRPAGTACLTVGAAECPQCGHKWESEPYSACGLSHHWFSGPCPQCGYAVGSAGSWSSTEGEPIEHRFRAAVTPAPPDDTKVCMQCGYREHGSVACEVVMAGARALTAPAPEGQTEAVVNAARDLDTREGFGMHEVGCDADATHLCSCYLADIHAALYPALRAALDSRPSPTHGEGQVTR